MHYFRKLSLLLWKNYLIQIRTPVRTLIELTIPLTMSIVLVILRLLVDSQEIQHPIMFENFTMNECLMTSAILSRPWNIGWSPEESVFAKIIMSSTDVFKHDQYTYGFESFRSEEEMEARIIHDKNSSTKDSLLAGIIFDDMEKDVTYPKHIKIRIRFPGLSRHIDLQSTTLDTQAPNWKTHIVFPLYQPFGPRDAHSKFGGQPGYCVEGFLPLQDRLFSAIYKHFKQMNDDFVSSQPEFVFQRFAYGPYTQDQYLPALILFISIFIILMYTYSCISTIKMVTVEKETQMKSAMKIMGLPNWMHWTAWTLKEFSQWMLPSTFITILLTIQWTSHGCVLRHTNPVVLLMILSVYAFTSIMLCFLISVCFNRANSAATVGSAVWFVTYAPYLVMQPHYIEMGQIQLRLWCLLSNTAIGYIFQFLVNYEGAGVGLQWDNLFITNSPTDSASAGDLLLQLLFDAVLYFCLAIYIETAFPGIYGIPKPWYFPLQPTYWCGYSRKDKDHVILQKGIQLKNLCKIYPNGKVAVANLSMEMHEDQITVMLGHNGAGKSSTMSMLSGLIKPTSGTAYVNGYDIWSEMSKIRECIGLCPQYNLLFPELTVKEHLQFFGMLKGRRDQDLEQEINSYVKRLEMESKLNCRAATLSGGYKRKLSVCIALVGKSKVVLVDEPTSGMDPNARRHLWDLLQVEREGRTVVMTTHMMGEADLLGDRIAILSEGRLKCIGTPFNLKTDPEGYRYTLSLVKVTSHETRKVDVYKITEFLKSYCDTICLASSSGTELKYKLVDSSELPKLLTTLNERKNEYGIKDFGISLISLEDVYMRVTRSDEVPKVSQIQHYEKDESEKHHASFCNGEVSVPISFSVGINKDCSKCERWKQEFKAMMVKKMLVSRRFWDMHLVQILITMMFVVIAYIVTYSWRGNTDLPPLTFSLKTYRKPVILIRPLKGPETNFTRDFFNILKQVVEEQNAVTQYTTESNVLNTNNNDRSFDQYLLNEYKKSLTTVNEKYIAAYGIEDDKIKIYFNNQPYHSLPIALNIAQNVLYKIRTNASNSLTFVNYPFPYLPSEKIIKLEGGSNLGFQIGFNTGFAQAFVSAMFLLSIMKEKITGARHLQYVSGVSTTAYWSASVFWDFIMYFLPLVTEVFMLYCYQDEAFSDPEQLVQVIVLFIAYNWAITPLMHVMSFLFDVPSLAFMIMSVIGLFTGCSVFLIALVMEIRPLLMIEEVRNLETVSIWFPHFALCNGLKNIYRNYDARISNHLTYEGNYSWEQPGIGRNLFVLFVVGFISNVTLLSVENIIYKSRKAFKIIKKYWSHSKKKPRFDLDFELRPDSNDSVDFDVAQEKYVVEKSSKIDYFVLVKNVSKYYGKVAVVKSINLALGSHECFALLGTNGAGKTTTFKMLTTQLNVDSGTISICSKDTVRERNQVLQIIGYCPQQDALIDKLTGREMLNMFCTLRGIPHQERPFVVSQLSNRLQFQEFLDVPAGNYSGGNKRKLNAAISMVGDPPVLLLDEPTSGMDPDARIQLWNVLQSEREKGKCVIITTHSFDECEALCTRMAVMVEGEIRCIGSAQYLKSKYASGHKLHVKFPTKLLENVKLHVSTHLPGSTIHEEFKGMITFQVPSEIPCSNIFSSMEKAKIESIIEDYSIQQTSLEQVFTQIVKNENPKV